MSKLNTRSWLLSHHGENNHTKNKPNRINFSFNAKTIAIASGKGGVGKTSAALKFSQIMAHNGFKTLLIDCDFNLTNTSVKLGLKLDNKFLRFLKKEINLDDCIRHVQGFDLISACNGEYDFVNNYIDLTSNIIDIMREKKNEYDFIILDCPAGLSKNTLNLFAYCDEHIVIMTPDRSSITDSYSLIKIINSHYNIDNISLLINKISTSKELKKVSSAFLSTVDHFLKCSVKIIGSIKYFTGPLDQFDRLLIKDAGSNLHKEFSKIVEGYTEKLWTDTGSVDSAINIPLLKNENVESFHPLS